MANTKLELQVQYDDSGAIKGLQVLQSNIKGATDASNRMSESFGAGAAKFAAATTAVLGYAAALKAATVGAAEYAARTETLSVVTDRLARVNNLSVAAVQSQVEAVKRQGITTQESFSVINKMIFAQLDLAKATQVARLAQDAAVIAGVNSSEALNGIIHGIVTRQPEVLRTYGIIVDFEAKYASAARNLGRDLTSQEKVQVALNAVLAEGAKITGTYESAMMTAGKQLTSLSRYVDEAKNSIGQGLVPALGNAVSVMKTVAEYAGQNAESFSRMAVGVTSLSVGLAAFKFTPGPLPLKLGAGAVAAGATYMLGTPDPVKYYSEQGSEALAKLEQQRRSLNEQFAGKKITAATYQARFDSLSGITEDVRGEVAKALAKVFIERGQGIIGEAERQAQKYSGGPVSSGDVLLAIKQQREGYKGGGALFNQQLFDQQQSQALADEAAKKAKAATESVSALLTRLAEEGLSPLNKEIIQMISDIRELRRKGASSGQIAAVQAAYGRAIARSPRFHTDIEERNPNPLYQSGFMYGWQRMNPELSEQPDTAYSDSARRVVVGARIAGIQGYATYQSQVAQLTAGPGEGVAAIQQGVALRLKAAREEFDITRDRLKLSQDIIEIERQGRLQILQLQKQQRDEYVNTVKGGFQALIAGGSGGFQSFVKSQGVGLASTVVGNLAGMTYKSGMLSLPGTGTADNPTLLGKLLSGTPFGPKLGPEEKMMTAADTQLKAAQIFAGAVTGGGVGGFSLAGIMPSGGTLGSLAGMLGPGGTSGFAGPLKGFSGLSLSSMDRSISIPGLPTTTLSAMIGGGLAAGQGIWSAINGLHGGGARGGFQTAGGIATAAGGILPLLSSSLSFLGPWGMAAGGALQLASMLFGDPKQNRQNSINRVLRGAAFYDPVAINMTMGSNGAYADYDRYGNARGSSLSPVPDILEPYSDWRRGVQVPGATGSQFGGNGPNTQPITVNVNALDSKSFSDHAEDIASAVGLAIKQGRAGTLPDALQNM